MNDNGWVVRPLPRVQARRRLFCFPYAGGGAAIFRTWAELLAPDVELWAVQLPGRENRLHEKAYTDLDTLIPDLVRALLPLLTPPFALFGHSMGALIAFELARTLHRRGAPVPTHLFVSAHRAPRLPRRRRPIHALPPDDFREEIRQLNGTPRAILENEELMALLLDMLRADFTLSETYTYRPGISLPSPIIAFGGNDDELAHPEEIAAWEQETSATFHSYLLPGTHFFLHSARSQLLRLIKETQIHGTQ